MKNKIIIISLIMGMIAIYSSCDEGFLDTAPLNESSDATFYTKEGDALAAVNAVYDVMQYRSTWKLEIYVIGNSFNNDNGITTPTMFPSNYQASNSRLMAPWGPFYIGVNRANIALARIPDIEMDEALKARLLGEVKFLRAFYNFTLSTYWKEIIIRKEPTTINNLEKAKSPRSEVRDFIRQDLNDAIAVLQERSEMDLADLGRATKGSATALLGKLELYDKNYAEAAAQFEKIINSNEYTLPAEYDLQFNHGGDNSSESIFEVQFVTNSGGAWGNESEGTFFSAWFSTPQEGITFGFGSGAQPNQGFVDEYEAGDLRRPYMIVEEGDDYFGVPFNSGASNTGFGTRKYIVPSSLEAGVPANSGINYHIIRYADVLMMYAEALNEIYSGPNGDAEDAINEVRARAGLLDLAPGLSQQEFFDALVHERRIELYRENVRTWDLIRWGIAEEVIGEWTGFVTGQHEWVPLPAAELNANPLLVQDPTYQ